MLGELKSKNSEKDRNRRWFSDEYFDLIVWHSHDRRKITGFQLCYDKEGRERAFSWSLDKGTSHNRIDGGEASPLKNMTPILVPDGAIPFDELLRQFQVRAQGLDKDIFELIRSKLQEGRISNTFSG